MRYFWILELLKRMQKLIGKIFKGILVCSVLPVVLLIRLIRPWFLFRFDCVHNRIGHFAGDLELYLCARDLKFGTPKKKYLDIFCVYPPACNWQLLIMFRRVLVFKPFLLINSILRMNRLIPGGDVHDIATHAKRSDRDIYGWLECTQSHLKFTPEEKIQGEHALRELGLPEGCRFICLQVRDAAFHGDESLFAHRNSDIDDYLLMAEKITELGYYVVRMGVNVKKKFNTKNKKIIDYPFSNQRTPFNDIYLGYKCVFCVTTNSGWDAVPRYLFRKPSVVINSSRLSYEHTFFHNGIFIIKKHIDLETKRPLSMSEIVARGVDLGDPYESRGVQLVDNTPEEILNVTLEMVERLEGSWKELQEDRRLQERFRSLFPVNALELEFGIPLHGKIRAKFGTDFLRKNHEWFLK